MIVRSHVVRFLRDERGATAIEYGLIAALLSIVVVAAMTFAGQTIYAQFDKIGAALK